MELVYCYEKYLGLSIGISKNRKSAIYVIKEKVAKNVGGGKRFFLVSGRGAFESNSPSYTNLDDEPFRNAKRGGGRPK